MDSLKLTFVQFLRFFVIFLTCVSSSSGLKGMIFVFAPSGLVLSALFAPSRLGFFLPVFFRLFRSARRRRVFHKQWGANGVIAW